VPLADKINHLLGLNHNIFNLTLARRDKYLMHNVLGSYGISHARQLLSDQVEDIVNFFRESTGKIVLKPPSSGNTDSVFYCTDEQQVRQHFAYILGRVNVLNEKNDAVLAQEYVEGTQYIVNAISSHGMHHITDIWQEVREDDTLPSNDLYADLLKRNNPAFDKLRTYTFSVLDALGIRTGPSHSEIRIRPDGEPCLIEAAARLSGGIDPSVIHHVYGMSSLSLVPDAFLNPELFKILVNTHIVQNKYVRHVYLFSPIDGEIKREVNINDFLKINSVYSVCFRFKKGDFLPKTNRAFLKQRPGSIYLINHDQQELDRDYHQLRLMEAKLYEDLLYENFRI
jgi:hypothetical protein